MQVESKQDLTPTNQNTRLTTRRHPISCILVPRHGHTHDNHPRRLKSPIHSIFTVLDPFYPHHFAFPFGHPAMPYRRGGTQYSKTDFSVKTFAKPLKQGTPVVPRDHNIDHAGPAQNMTIISPTVLPLNPFQSFCFARFCSRQRLLAPTTPKKVSTAKKNNFEQGFQ